MRFNLIGDQTAIFLRPLHTVVRGGDFAFRLEIEAGEDNRSYG